MGIMDEGDKASNNTQGTQPAAGQQQGIFSTPDLTVNPENIAGPTPEQMRDDRSRIMSAFSQRSIERRQEIGEVVPASVVDDAVVVQDRPKNSKKGVIIFAIIGVVAAILIAVVAMLVVQNVKKANSIPLNAFEDFKNYMTNIPEELLGEEDVNEKPEKPFLFMIDNISLGRQMKQGYYDTLLGKFANFQNAVIESKQGLNTDLTDLINQTRVTLNSIVLISLNSNPMPVLLEKYNEGGLAAVRSYANGIVKDEEVELFDTEVVNNVKYLFDANAEAVSILARHGCIEENEIISWQCIDDIENGIFGEEVSEEYVLTVFEQNDASEQLHSSLENKQKVLQSMLNELEIKMKDFYGKR